jgi:LacI family transcriptional regulator
MTYRNYLQANGLDWSPASEIAGNDTHDGGIATAQRLVEQHPELDSVLVFNDVMALGALKGFVRAGRRVPDDVAVIGIDGLDIGTLVTPELTSVALDKTELALQAIQLVDELLRGADAGRSLAHRTLTHTLVVRESA